MTNPQTDAWLDRFAAALAERLGGTGMPPLDQPTRSALLDLARVVAHGTERKNAPLATYLAGGYVAGRVARGAAPDAALTELRDTVAGLVDDDG
ncbi:MAG: DUF6457 domain-containing protein [Egibacteraceae bacterium]